MINFIRKVIGEDWFNLLGMKFVMTEVLKLGHRVKLEREKYTVYPGNGLEIFSIFRNLPPTKVKIVIIGQDPYHDGSYDGRAFSNSNKSSGISPSLRNILKEVEDDIYKGLNLNQDPCLKRWESQGVLLMNRTLTVRAGQAGSHRHLGWEAFTNKIISRLSETSENLVFMLWGADARSVMPKITGNHLILTSGHPSPLSANQGFWFKNKHFSQANEYLEKHNKLKITW